MKCTLCDRTAIWQVGKEGYCRAHKAEAYAAEAMKNQQRHRAKVEGETLDKMGTGPRYSQPTFFSH